LSVVIVVCCQIEVSAAVRSLVQRSPTNCACVCVCVECDKGQLLPLHLQSTSRKRPGKKKLPSFCLLKYLKRYVAFKVLAVDSWDVTPCVLMGGNQHFEGISYFHLQAAIPGWTNRNARRILEHRILKDARTTAFASEAAAWSLTPRQNRRCMHVCM
jgi:hypothetical protein